MRTYAMRYKMSMEQGAFTAEELKASGDGGCDALLFMSMNRLEDGGMSHCVYGYDGATGGDVTGPDMVRAWAHLTYVIAKHPGVSAGWRAVALQCHQLIKHMLLAKRRDDAAPQN